MTAPLFWDMDKGLQCKHYINLFSNYPIQFCIRSYTCHWNNVSCCTAAPEMRDNENRKQGKKLTLTASYNYGQTIFYHALAESVCITFSNDFSVLLFFGFVFSNNYSWPDLAQTLLLSHYSHLLNLPRLCTMMPWAELCLQTLCSINKHKTGWLERHCTGIVEQAWMTLLCTV